MNNKRNQKLHAEGKRLWRNVSIGFVVALLALTGVLIVAQHVGIRRAQETSAARIPLGGGGGAASERGARVDGGLQGLAENPSINQRMATFNSSGGGSNPKQPPFPATSADSGRLLEIVRDSTASLDERAAAIDALGKMGTKESAETLQQILGDDSEALPLKYKAARALGMINDDKAVPLLSTLLTNQTTDRHLRVVCALALGNIGTTDALRTLGNTEQDSDSLIRFKSVQALEKSNTSMSRAIIAKALTDSDIYVQARAIHTLGKLGDDSSITTVDQILHSTESDFIRIACFTALGNINRQEATTILREYEYHTNQLLSLNARAALQRLNH